MEHIIKKIKKGAKHTRLTVIEKAEMRNVLVRHMKVNPVRSNAWGIPTTSNGAGPVIVSPFNINNFRNKKGISILVIGGLLMGGTVSLAAENTVPGDALFSVKVHVNENVRGAVAVTSKAKAEWEVRLVERRLEEVEKLAMTPSVSPEVQQVAEKNLEHYAERVKNRIEKFDNDEDGDNAIETASKLSDVFISHEKTFTKFHSNKKVASSIVATTTDIIDNETVSVKEALETVRNARGDAEKKHKELKEKYKKEKVEESVKIETKKPTSTKTSKERAENSDHKQKDEIKEDIHSTVTNTQSTSTPSVFEAPKPKEEEDKKREEIRSDDRERDEDSS